MPSLWPFARDDSSPASFERALSKLSTQITASTISLEKSRTRAHRSKAFWTLWSTLAYLIYTIIVALVLGPQQWSLPHYAGLLGAPLVIYGVRRGLALLFDWQISRQQGHLDRLVRERDHKITQLKTATRYDTTQELLNKYGGSTPKLRPGEKQSSKTKGVPSKPAPQQQQYQRTGISPPPTANIPGRNPTGSQRGTRPSQDNVSPNTPPPHAPKSHSPLSTGTMPNSPETDFSPDEPGFAPNAFSGPPPSSAYAPKHPHRWYDRILDVMLGEDETLAKNRLALICDNCRLVNGQAAPGVRTVEEIGRWRCGSCRAWNGIEKLKVAKEVEKEVGRMVQEMKTKQAEGSPGGGDGGWTKVSRGDEEMRELSDSSGERRRVKEEGDDESVGDTAEEEEEEEEEGTTVSASSENEADREAESIANRVARSKRSTRSSKGLSK